MTPEDLRRASRALEVATLGLDRNAAADYARLAAGLRAMADAEPVTCLWARNGHTACQATPQRPQWQGLMEDERQAISLQVLREDSGLTWRDAIAAAIESALRAKNRGAA